jgi:hypothetical protein
LDDVDGAVHLALGAQTWLSIRLFLGSKTPGVNRAFHYFHLRIRMLSLFSEPFCEIFLHLAGEASP